MRLIDPEGDVDNEVGFPLVGRFEISHAGEDGLNVVGNSLKLSGISFGFPIRTDNLEGRSLPGSDLGVVESIDRKGILLSSDGREHDHER